MPNMSGLSSIESAVIANDSRCEQGRYGQDSHVHGNHIDTEEAEESSSLKKTLLASTSDDSSTLEW